MTTAYYLDRARIPSPVRSDGSMSSVWAQILGINTDATVSLTDQQISGLPALNKAKSLCVNAVSAMLTAATVVDADGAPLATPQMIRRPHPLLTAVEFWRQVVDSLIMHGNYVAIRLGDQLVPVPLGACSVDTSSGLPEYRIGERRYTWREVLHIRHAAPVGTWWGVGVVEQFRRPLSEQLHSQAYGESSFRTGAVPSMLVQLDQDAPTQEQADAAKSSLVGKLGGGAREPLVYGKALSITPVGWSPHDAEFVESRRLSYAEAAWLVGLRPEDIGATAGSSLTYANRSDDSLQRITDGYGPWLALVEASLGDLLPEGQTVRGNPEALLRTSTRERLEIRRLAQEIGVETPEESRAEEGRTPLVVTAPGADPTPDTDAADDPVEGDEP